MSPLRYQELREAGPTITADDAKWIATFQPKTTLLAVAVWFALSPQQWKLYDPRTTNPRS